MSKENTCPDWALTLLKKLRETEIELGNIVDKTQDHLVKKLIEIGTNQEKIIATEDDNDLSLEERSEFLFRQVVQGLSKQNFNVEQIALWINNVICPDGGMPYCNEQEVESVIQ